MPDELPEDTVLIMKTLMEIHAMLDRVLVLLEDDEDETEEEDT